MALRLRRGTDAERQTITPLEGELIYTTDTKELYVGDGSTAGGLLVSSDLLDDTTPALGGDLNLNGNNITGTGNINIDGTITATGNINLGDGAEDNVIVGGQISSNLIPKSDDVYDLGSALSVWSNVYTSGLTVETSASITNIELAENIYTADSGLLYNGDTRALYSATIESDLFGSVVAEDSVVLVDSVSNALSDGVLTLQNGIFNTSGANSSDVEAGLGSTIQFGTLENGAAPIFLSEGVLGLMRGTGDAVLKMQKSRGTLDAPIAVEPDDFIGLIFADGYDGTDYVNSGLFGLVVDPRESVTPGDIPGAFIVDLFENGSSNDITLIFDTNGVLTLPSNGYLLGDVKGNVDGELTGSVYSDGSTQVIDGTTGTIVNLDFRGQTGNTPSDTDNVDSWLEVTVNGDTKYIPLYS